MPFSKPFSIGEIFFAIFGVPRSEWYKILVSFCHFFIKIRFINGYFSSFLFIPKWRSSKWRFWPVNKSILMPFEIVNDSAFYDSTKKSFIKQILALKSIKYNLSLKKVLFNFCGLAKNYKNRCFAKNLDLLHHHF